MKQHNEKNLEAEILQRVAQQMNDIAEQIAAFALDCTAAMRRVLESKALQEALQAAIQRFKPAKRARWAASQKLPPTWKAHTGRIAIRWATSSR